MTSTKKLKSSESTQYRTDGVWKQLSRNLFSRCNIGMYIPSSKGMALSIVVIIVEWENLFVFIVDV